MASSAPDCRTLSWSRSGAGGDADAVLAPLGGGVHSELAQDVLAHGRPRCEGALEVGVLGVHLRQRSQPSRQHLLYQKYSTASAWTELGSHAPPQALSPARAGKGVLIMPYLLRVQAIGFCGIQGMQMSLLEGFSCGCLSPQ